MDNGIVTTLKFENLQKGWEGINEFLFLEADLININSGGIYGPEMVSYNNFVVMDRAWVDPDFNFGKILGYSIAKWSALVNNYVDFYYLDLMRAEISRRVATNTRAYNYTYHFDNKHGGGKDCLVAITFTKRFFSKRPIVVFQIRTSEVTKRLLFDFLLVQRVTEYIYGHNDVEVHFFAPSVFVTRESFVMYNNVKSIKKLYKDYVKKNGKPSVENRKFQTKVKETFEEYMNHPDPMSVIYKVNRRSILQIQKDKDGNPMSGVKDLFARDLKLRDTVEKLPTEVINKNDLRSHNLKIKKDAKKTKSNK